MPPDLILNTILNDFRGATAGYYPELLRYGAGLLSAMALLGCGVAWAQAGFDMNPHRLLPRVLLSILQISLVYTVMEHVLDWGQGMVDTGTIIGSAVSGIAISPSEFYTAGLNLVDGLDSARGWGLWLIGVFTLDDLVWWIMITAIQFVWLAASVIYLITLLESVMLIMAAPIVICWAPVEFTWSTIYAWGGRLLYISTKLLVLMLVLAIGMVEANNWTAYVNSTGFLLNLHFYYNLSLVLTESLVFFWCVWHLPESIASLLRVNGGSVSYASGDAAFAGYAQTAGGAAITAATGTPAELGAYVQRKLIS